MTYFERFPVHRKKKMMTAAVPLILCSLASRSHSRPCLDSSQLEPPRNGAYKLQTGVGARKKKSQITCDKPSLKPLDYHVTSQFVYCYMTY